MIIRFRVQFGINLHEWVFQKAEIVRAASASAFLKNSQVQINFKLNEKNRIITYKQYKHENMRAEKVLEYVSWSLFRIRENVLQSFHTKFLSLLYIRSLEYKISYCLSVNQNPELWCVICTDVTLFHWCVTLELHWSQPIRIE